MLRSQRATAVNQAGIGSSGEDSRQGLGARVPVDVPGLDGCSCNACPYMRMNSLEKLRDCLETLSPQITMEESIRSKAEAPIRRMLEMSK